MAEPQLHYFHTPTGLRPVPRPVEFLPAADFLADEPACTVLWDLITSQFHTRGKFLAVWSGVRFVAVSRDDDGVADGFLLVNAPVNWQLDYVVVRPDRRGHGVASALLAEALNQALLRGVPYVMLTSKASLRPLYEGCGFAVVGCGVAPLAGRLTFPALFLSGYNVRAHIRKESAPCAGSSGSPAGGRRRRCSWRGCGGSSTAGTTAPG